MAKPSKTERLQHILDAIHDIEHQTGDKSFETFKEDRFLRLGIERCLEIISEASRHIPAELKETHPEIPWLRVADIGNRIRHAYHAVDSEIIWEIINNELRTLRAAVEKMARS